MVTYERMSVRPVINAYGPMTFLGGSRMPTEVVEAWVEASKSFVNMWDLHQAAGRIVAQLMGVDMGLVTAGCAAAMATAVAACIVKRSGIVEPEKLRKLLPHCDSVSNKILIAMSHRNMYNQAFEVGGGRLVEFGNKDGFRDEDLEEAITEDTVAIAFQFTFGVEAGRRDLKALKEVCSIARRHHLPVIVDAAAEMPPRENLRRIVETGADLICISGGKDIMGPNDSGLLFGRKDLMLIAHWLSCPNQQVARSMKIGKEGIVAQVAALQRYMALDEEARTRNWEKRVQYWIDQLSDIPHVEVEKLSARGELSRARCWPRVAVTIDEKALNTTAAQIIWELSQGNPPIYVAYFETYIENGELYMKLKEEFRSRNFFILNPNFLSDEEVKVVAERVREVLLDPPKCKKPDLSRRLT